MLESKLRDHLAENLWKFGGLKLIGTEMPFPGGRYDILAKKKSCEVAIEVKARNYDTNKVLAQLQKYHNSLPKGEVYFVAPKVKRGMWVGMKHIKNFSMFEVNANLAVSEVKAEDLDDSRHWPKIALPRYGIKEFILDLALEKLVQASDRI